MQEETTYVFFPLRCVGVVTTPACQAAPCLLDKEKQQLYNVQERGRLIMIDIIKIRSHNCANSRQHVRIKLTSQTLKCLSESTVLYMSCGPQVGCMNQPWLYKPSAWLAGRPLSLDFLDFYCWVGFGNFIQ